MAMVSILIGMLYALVSDPYADRYKMHAWIKHIGCIAGLVVGFIVFMIKMTRPKATNIAIIKFHRIMVIVSTILALVSFISFVILRHKRKKQELKTSSYTLPLIFYALLITCILSFTMPTVYKYTTEFVYFGEDSISSMMLLRVVGFTLGVILCYVIGLSAYKLVLFIDEKKSLLVVELALLITSVGYGVKSITAMQRLKLIKLNPFIFKIMVFNDSYGNVFIYVLLALLAILAVYIIQTSKEVKGTYPNNALRRKEKAKLLHQTRWARNTVFQAILVVLVLTVVYNYDNKEIPLTPPQGYALNGDIISIPLSDVDDGHLHRFEFSTPNGFDVRFIIVKKPQGVAYGVGLDACEICGIAGYIERGDDIICKRCDVVMNKNTIGFKGGCNPIPFPYEIKDQQIFINTKDLIAEEMRFR